MNPATYINSVIPPYLQKDIQCLESVQRAATRLISGCKKFSYDQRLRSAGLTTLEVRRQRGDLIECYKISTGKENIDSHQLFQLSDNSHGLRGHSLKLSVNRSRLDLRKKLLQSKGDQFLEQSSSASRQRHLG